MLDGSEFDRKLHRDMQYSVNDVTESFEFRRIACAPDLQGRRSSCQIWSRQEDREEFLGDGMVYGLVAMIILEKYPDEHTRFCSDVRRVLTTNQTFEKIMVAARAAGPSRVLRKYVADDFEARLGRLWTRKGLEATLEYIRLVFRPLMFGAAKIWRRHHDYLERSRYRAERSPVYVRSPYHGLAYSSRPSNQYMSCSPVPTSSSCLDGFHRHAARESSYAVNEANMRDDSPRAGLGFTFSCPRPVPSYCHVGAGSSYKSLDVQTPKITRPNRAHQDDMVGPSDERNASTCKPSRPRVTASSVLQNSQVASTPRLAASPYVRTTTKKRSTENEDEEHRAKRARLHDVSNLARSLSSLSNVGSKDCPIDVDLEPSPIRLCDDFVKAGSTLVTKATDHQAGSLALKPVSPTIATRTRLRHATPVRTSTQIPASVVDASTGRSSALPIVLDSSPVLPKQHILSSPQSFIALPSSPFSIPDGNALASDDAEMEKSFSEISDRYRNMDLSMGSCDMDLSSEIDLEEEDTVEELLSLLGPTESYTEG